METDPSWTFRQATADDIPALNTLTRASQLHWGYPVEFLDWATDIVVTPDKVGDGLIQVLEHDGEMVGYYGLLFEAGHWNLGSFFVAASRIRTGIGSRMWPHLIESLHSRGISELMIWSEPNAVGFYRSRGAVLVREQVTSWPGFVLHLMRYPVPEPGAVLT